jgi:predicted ferric reductase
MTVNRVRTVLALEAAAFAAAALVHSGLVVGGHEHWKAATAELVIAVVLLAGLTAGVASAHSTRAAALAVQGFALLGTLVGIFTIAVGVGPRSTFDYALHAGFVTALVAGLVLVARGGGRAARHA